MGGHPPHSLVSMGTIQRLRTFGIRVTGAAVLAVIALNVLVTDTLA